MGSSARNARSRVVLPIPASPLTATTDPRPSTASRAAVCNCLERNGPFEDLRDHSKHLPPEPRRAGSVILLSFRRFYDVSSCNWGEYVMGRSFDR